MTELALLFTDVVDSTRLTERLGDTRAAQLWAAHDQRARELLAHHAVREIDRTDGFFLVFDRVVDAASFVLAYHAALAGLGMQGRAGLHVGPVTLRENAPEDVARGAKRVEVEGLAKPLAARVMGLAQAGQTLMTAAARSSLGGALAQDTHIERHGFYRLKGVEELVEIHELGVRDVSKFMPPPDVEKAYRVVRAGDLWMPVRDVRHNLPAERDAFIGRTAELRALAARFDEGARLVTVLGPGGTGKTRLVRRYGSGWLGDWPGGVYFCDLSEARSLDGIFFAVAAALEVPLGREDPVVQLGHAIAGRGRCLVILDNFEQVVQHAAATAGRWLDRAPEAAFLVTTRERVHLAGEDILPVEPLPLEDDAIELFAARAHAQRPDFLLTEGNRAAVAQIVRLLDGLPLAIELAAARIRIFSPAQLVERMRDRFALLAGARGAAARQATLQGAIDWSWELLAAWEQAAFAQCAVFDGGFTLEAAEAVLDLSPWPEAPPAMDVIQALADKSLLRTWIPATQSRYDIDEPFFGMYLSIREYAANKLEASGSPKKRTTEERHGRYFAGFGGDDALEGLAREGGVKRRLVLALELDNLVAACRRAAMRNDAGVAVATYRASAEVFALHGPFAADIALGEQVLSLEDLSDAQRTSMLAMVAQSMFRAGRMEEAKMRLDDALLRARMHDDARREAEVLVGLGSLHREQARGTQARACLEEALAIARRIEDRACEADAQSGLAILDRQQSHPKDAREHFEAALAIARELGDRHEEGIVLGGLGLLHSEAGEGERARREFEAALAVAREVDDRALEGTIEGNLAQLLFEQGRFDEAHTHLETALAIHREVGNRRLEGIVLGNLGPLWMFKGHPDASQECFEGALAIARELGNRRHQSFLHATLGILRHGQGRLSEARADYEAALVIAREVGDRRSGGIALSRLGLISVEQGKLAEARTRYELALDDARQGGYRRLEGVVLGGLGALLVKEGKLAEGLASLRAGEGLLREVDDREELAKLLCIRGEIEVAAGARDSAIAALEEATAIAQALRATSDSELGRRIETLRGML